MENFGVLYETMHLHALTIQLVTGDSLLARFEAAYSCSTSLARSVAKKLSGHPKMTALRVAAASCDCFLIPEAAGECDCSECSRKNWPHAALHAALRKPRHVMMPIIETGFLTMSDTGNLPFDAVVRMASFCLHLVPCSRGVSFFDGHVSRRHVFLLL